MHAVRLMFLSAMIYQIFGAIIIWKVSKKYVAMQVHNDPAMTTEI